MLRLAFAVVLCALVMGAQAQAQNVPQQKINLGPTVGEQYYPASAYIAGVNSQTGTSYTILPSDMGKLVAFNNGSAIAVTLPQAGTPGFEANKQFCLTDIGAGAATVTPTTSTINTAANKAYAQGVRGCIVSDGTNYWSY